MSVEIFPRGDGSSPDSLLDEFFEAFDFYGEGEKALIKSSWGLLARLSQGARRACGAPWCLHPMRVAFILAQNKLDGPSIRAQMLHGASALGAADAEIRECAGADAALIIDEARKISSIVSAHSTLQQADAIRKMAFALSRDARAILVKLSDKLDRIRNIKSMDEKSRRALAEEAIDIWAPLADRLGMQSVKNELEDQSLKYTNPDVFLQIKAIVAQKKGERAAYLERAVEAMKSEALKAGIDVEVKSRAKHFYSIYQKMRKRNKDASELFDLLALRVICSKQSECYTLLGIAHSLWKPLDGRFKDYIAMPKSNGYQSLHTTVMREGKPLEIQIRTREMDERAEKGIASHWLYKKGSNGDTPSEAALGVFNDLRAMAESGGASDEKSFSALKNDLLGDKIFVFTPKGEVVELPVGSNAIDFAYRIHTAVGEKISGAKADGKIIPLFRPLKNTQIIEVLTRPDAHPTEAQLKSCRTSKARQKIHAWLSEHDSVFRAEAERKESERKNFEAARKAREEKGKKKDGAAKPTGKIRIGDATNFLVTFAKCCSPVWPEKIIGCISRARGITIHRADCPMFRRIANIERRTVEVSWDE